MATNDAHKINNRPDHEPCHASTTFSGAMLRAIREYAGWSRTRMAYFIARTNLLTEIERLRAERVLAEQTAAEHIRAAGMAASEAEAPSEPRKPRRTARSILRHAMMASTYERTAGEHAERARMAATMREELEQTLAGLGRTSSVVVSMLSKLKGVERMTVADEAFVVRYRCEIGPELFDAIVALLEEQAAAGSAAK